jgi:Uma2 family endonuclease
MNTHARLTMDKATFFRWADGREGRFELKNGIVQMMIGVTRGHQRVMMGLAKALIARLSPMEWEISTEGFAVEIDEDIRYPDIMVERPAADMKALSTTKPTLIAEVLSPSSIALDMHIKAAEYMSLASLEAYIVAAQDEPRLWIWNRGRDAARAWPKEPQEVHGRDKAVPIPGLGVELPMAEVYAALPA